MDHARERGALGWLTEVQHAVIRLGGRSQDIRRFAMARRWGELEGAWRSMNGDLDKHIGIARANILPFVEAWHPEGRCLAARLSKLHAELLCVASAVGVEAQVGYVGHDTVVHLVRVVAHHQRLVHDQLIPWLRCEAAGGCEHREAG